MRLAGLVLLNTSPAPLPSQQREDPSPTLPDPAGVRSEISRLTGMVSEIVRQQRMQLSLQQQLNDANAKLTTSEASNDSELAQHLDSLDLLDRANLQMPLPFDSQDETADNARQERTG
ncbi:hypothetical protein PUR61_29565 [Streptomyces sp. BE20]|uniref:hypothetical protein n=1 Tax=Streptomyces sp. BE20 TaxID=3002525 RepID=UPI002E76B6D2|nr:hypothetical protein [Streptomyces sp. BE20]MEE1826306.1 hypothetical protein [Streptomyces sp. BE20]